MVLELQHTVYHSVLRVGAVVLAVVLLFDSGLLVGATARLSQHTQLYLANAVGVYVGVSENDVNRLTTRITELEQEVSRKDQELRDREMNIGLAGGITADTSTTFILSGILFIMLVLIVLNYALDYARAKERDRYYEKSTSVA